MQTIRCSAIFDAPTSILLEVIDASQWIRKLDKLREAATDVEKVKFARTLRRIKSVKAGEKLARSMKRLQARPQGYEPSQSLLSGLQTAGGQLQDSVVAMLKSRRSTAVNLLDLGADRVHTQKAGGRRVFSFFPVDFTYALAAKADESLKRSANGERSP